MADFSETVKREAEFFKAMKNSGMLKDEDVEFLKQSGLDFDEKWQDQEIHETSKPWKSCRKPRKRSNAQRSLIMLSQPVKTRQDRLRP